MTHNANNGSLLPERDGAGDAISVGLIVGGGVLLSNWFACVTPFAALATIAALKLPLGRASAAIALVWLANQVIGYGVLGYPWTWESVAWGAAIGASAECAVLAASSLTSTRAAPLKISLPFMAAFAAYESGLYVAGYALPSSGGAFSGSVIGEIGLVNAVALCALLAVRHLARLAERFAWSASRDDSAVAAQR